MKRILVCVAGLAMAFAAAQSAAAAEYAVTGVFTNVSIGTSYEIEAGHTFWVGQFSGLFDDADDTSPFDDLTLVCPGWLDIGVGGAGYCTGWDAAGDMAYASWTCTAAPPPEGALLGLDCTWTYTGGTGKFAGISGGGPFTAATVAFTPAGHGVGYAQWNGAATLPD